MSAKAKLAATVVCVVSLLVAVICAIWISVDRGSDKTKIDLYFLNADGSGIEARKDTVRYKNEDELIRNTLKKLRRGPSQSNLGAVMPRDTEVTEIRLSGNQLMVNLSENFMTDDPSRNVLNVYAVVKTLSSTSVVSSVKVLAGGKAIRDKDGNKLGFIDASDINLETEEYQSEVRQVALYFANPAEDMLVREMRSITITDQQPIEQYIINELIKGTKSKMAKSLLSDDTVLVSVDVEENICYLNFRSSFLAENEGSDIHERLVIYSIVNSLTELQTIGRVQFYMDGKRVNDFGSIAIGDYLSRDTNIINSEG